MSEETNEARTERVLAAQAQWAPRDVAITPGEILREWMAASPENRMSALATRLADPAQESEITVEAYGPLTPPVPGGLREQLAERSRAKAAAAQAQLDEINKHLPPTSRIY